MIPPTPKGPFFTAERILWLAVYSLFQTLARAETLDYNRDIRPILSENCFSCHGFDEKGRKAGLRLDVAAEAYGEKNGSIAIKPQDLANSEAWRRITSEDPEEQMPPPKAHLTLTPAQKEKIKTWIEQGAQYADHWAFIPPRRPTLPVGSANPIDVLVQQRLAAEGLKPAPEAEREMLVRRLFLDLTGLPPTSTEAEAFSHDPSQQAYGSLVDRLLASPHFGERLALEWLDAARYADSNGFSIDGGRTMWLWRDWVIQAFNDNKPYDQFLTEQLAGDLLPKSTDAQRIATGFQRNNMVTHEGGTIPEENLTNYNADRVKTLGEAVLGLTLGCAQCHDHKFDPITQKDYYQMFAFFNTLGDRGLDGDGGVNPGPSIRARTVLKTNEEPLLKTQIAALETKLATPDAALLSSWEEEQRSTLDQRGRDFAAHPTRILKVSTPNRGNGFELAGENGVRLPHVAALAAYDVSMELPQLTQPITGLRVVFHAVPSLPGGGWGSGLQGTSQKGTFMLTGISVTAGAMPNDQINLHKLERISRVTANAWIHGSEPADCLDPRPESGWSPDPVMQGPARLTITLVKPISTGETRFLTAQLVFGRGRKLIPGHFEFFAITGTDDDIDLPSPIIAALRAPAGDRSPEQCAALWKECSETSPQLARARVDLANLKERLASLTEPHQAMVMHVAAQPRETFILNRGDYAQPTVKVNAGTPAALPALPDGAATDRLGLARWITMKNHPLTARVAVNRFWQMLFGTGLVATPADFGLQGEWPSHPELLDWLAVEFVESGWDVKRMIKLIVMSGTYRQTSAATAGLLERDPQNRLLARGPRFRLAAEFIRDSSLKTAGLLSPRIGGPSVNPYLPGDLWREVSHYGSTPATAQAFVQDHGEKLYRRSLYTFWKRTAPPPNMTAFDAPNREVCNITRGNTTTPLQALVTLNDPQFVEAARALGQRALQQTGDDATRLRWAFCEAVSRQPKATELTILQSALQRERQHYCAQPEAAAQALSTGESPLADNFPAPEMAAWMQVCSLLLNLSESVTRN